MNEGQADQPVVDLFEEFCCEAQPDSGKKRLGRPPGKKSDLGAGESSVGQPDLSGTFDPSFRDELRTRFYASPEPSRWLKYEKPYHRMMAMLSAEGHSLREIAQMTGFTTVSISNVLRQPWMQKIILEHIATQSDQVMLSVRAECLKSVDVIKELRDTAESEPVRLKAAQDFLDRTYGKPNQPMSVSQVDASQLSDDELAKLATKQN